MKGSDYTVLMTRPERQSSEFIARCEREFGERISAVISPVFRIEDVGEIPPLDEFRTLIFTSGHAVRRLGIAGELKGRRVATVGQATAELAREFGASAKAYGDDIETFLANFGGLADPCLHLRGRHSRGNLAARLTELRRMTGEAIIYDQIAIPLSREAQNLITGSKPIIAPLFSPRSAELLAKFIRRHRFVKIIAMSEAVADASGSGHDVKIAEQPTIEAMCGATVAMLRQASLVEQPDDD